MFFITKQYETSMMVCYSMNKCVLCNVQILIKLKEHKKSFNKVQAFLECFFFLIYVHDTIILWLW